MHAPVRPLLKWAGGKRQLLPAPRGFEKPIETILQHAFLDCEMRRMREPVITSSSTGVAGFASAASDCAAAALAPSSARPPSPAATVVDSSSRRIISEPPRPPRKLRRVAH